MPGVPSQTPFDENGQPNKPWIDWADEVSKQGKYKGESTTANRPTNGLNNGDWLLDTTLGKPIWYYSGGWIDATGASV
jgi:hypothetical protein